MRDGATDLALIHGSTRAWVLGVNPYDARGVDRVYLDAGGPAVHSPATRGSRDLLYPPTTFAVLAPLGLLPWRTALAAWGVLNFAALAAGLWGIVRALNWPAWDARTGLLILFALLFAPVHTNFAHGQTGLVCFGLIAAAVGIRRGGRPRLAGVLLGLATALKPQVAAIFIAYDALQRRWSAVAAACVAVGLATLLGVGRLAFADIPWLSQYRDNLRAFSHEWVGDPTPVNPYRYQMLNLHYPLHNFIDSRAAVTALVWALLGVAGLAYLALRRGREDRGEMLSLSLASAAALLLVYHRFYDAAVMLFALAFVIDRFHGLIAVRPIDFRRLVPVLAVAVGLASLFVPGAAVLFILERDARLPAWIVANPIWRSLIMPHQVWALVLIAAALPVALACAPKRSDTRQDAG